MQAPAPQNAASHDRQPSRQYGLKLRLGEGQTLEAIENWLDSHIHGRWRVEFMGVGSVEHPTTGITTTSVHVAIYFHNRDDVDRFKAGYLGDEAAKRRVAALDQRQRPIRPQRRKQGFFARLFG